MSCVSLALNKFLRISNIRGLFLGCYSAGSFHRISTKLQKVVAKVVTCKYYNAESIVNKQNSVGECLIFQW